MGGPSIRTEQSYSHRTLVNNWNEDVQQLEGKYEEYRCKKLQGKLHTDRIERRQEFALQHAPVSLKNAGDQILFGDAVMLHQTQTDTVLAVEPKKGEDWIASTTTADVPRARNVFHLVHPTSKDEMNGTPLSYGQALCLVSEPVLSTDDSGMVLSPYYLKSIPKSFSSMARLSTESKVLVEERYSENALWVVETAAKGNKAKQLNNSGKPVLAGAEIILKHKMTNTPLSVDKSLRYNTNLSKEEEFEAFCCVNNMLLPRCTWSIIGSPYETSHMKRTMIPFALDKCVDELVMSLGGKTGVERFVEKLHLVNSTDMHSNHETVVLSIEELTAYLKVSLRNAMDDRKIALLLSNLATDGRIAVADLNNILCKE